MTRVLTKIGAFLYRDLLTDLSYRFAFVLQLGGMFFSVAVFYFASRMVNPDTAGLDGIQRELDPGEPLNDDLYRRGRKELKAAGIDLLPRTLLHALEAFEASELPGQAFGGFYRDIYLNHKLREWERGFYPVHEEQRRSMLTFI